MVFTKKGKKMMSVQMESCTIEKNGFNAFYYPGKVADDMAIISVGGASCDEKKSIAMSGFLRKAGYTVLVLGFYMWKGMSKNLVSIPIDYVEKAVDWLKNEKGIKKIVMTGASTGAGYTLACASLIKEIGCVIPIVPFDYVMEGTTSSFKRLGRSVYTWHGEDLPFSPWTIIEKGIPKFFFEAVKDKKYGLPRFMRYGYDHNLVKEESRIKIENMHAAVLFLAVENDDGILNAGLTPALIQPTTFGEISERNTKRTSELSKLFHNSHIPYQIVPDMHLWQLCHLAMVVPIADAYYESEDPENAGADRQLMSKKAGKIKRNMKWLKKHEGKLSPKKFYMFTSVPKRLIAVGLTITFKSEFGDRFMYRHSMKAPDEMRELHRKFYGYIKDRSKKVH